MEKSEVKKILKNRGNIMERCNEKTEQIKYIYSLMDSTRDIKGYILSDMPKSTDVSKPIERAVIKNIDVYEKQITALSEEILLLLEEKSKIDFIISRLDPLEQNIIFLKYEKKYSWQYIALKLNCSVSTLYRMNNKLLDKIASYLQK